jgi:hypothetical protein
MWTGFLRDSEATHIYGGTFTPAGELIANFFPMTNMSEAAGFGGIRRYQRGANRYEPIIGITRRANDYVHRENPTSYGIENGNYAGEPAVLPDGRILISWALDFNQDYGLYVINPDGTGRTLVYDNAGTTELQAQVIRPRPVPPIIPDQITQVPSLLPPPAEGPYDQDGTFVFDALNVYFNAPVDVPIINAPAVGSASQIRYFIDQQRTSYGSFPNLDWPILLAELTVNSDGSTRNPNAPANVPLFEQLRSPSETVPTTTGPKGIDGAAHVAGMNFGRPGEVSRCVGCHAGHSMIPVPENDADAQWTNLAPGALATVSSSRDANTIRGLTDRQVMNGEVYQYWSSTPGQPQNQWVKLTFPVPVTIRTVRLYNPRTNEAENSTIQVTATTVRLYSDAAGTNQVASQTTGSLSVAGTDIQFNEVRARVILVEINGVTGTIFGRAAASLGEIEVIARGEAGQ